MDPIRDCDACKHYVQGEMTLRCFECVSRTPRGSNTLPMFEPIEPEEDLVDVVNHPPHYTQGNIEVIDFIEDQKMDYFEGNIIKYVSRYKFKNGVEDLRKARFYLDKLIAKNVKGED